MADSTVCEFGGGHVGTPASVFIVLHRLRVMRPMMLISLMVSAPYSSLSAEKRLSLESPDDTNGQLTIKSLSLSLPPTPLSSTNERNAV